MSTMPPDPPDPIEPGFGGLPSIPPPPGHWVGPPLAEWPQRLISGLVDIGIPWALWWVLTVLLEAFFLGLLAYWGVVAYIQYLQGTTGQSPGKRVAGTKLLREADGQPLGFGNAFLRAVLHVVDAAPCGLGFFWPIWDPKRQTFADKIVSSVVIRAS